MTTLQKTVEIPANHRLAIDIEVPKEIPAGTATFRLEWITTPENTMDAYFRKKPPLAQTMEEIWALCKDSTVTVDSFLEERHAERDLEEDDI
jgi:hypothetical protein